METKANYLLIGLFTITGLLCSMAFLLWLAKVQVDQQYSYYFVHFDNVTGLSNAGDVRYNGLPVGRVVDLQLDPDDPAKVRARIELDVQTPIKTDTVATLQSQGVTGVSFVALTGGSAEAPILAENGVIEAQPSPLQSVLEGAPVLLQRAVDLLEDINEVVSDDNRAAVSLILENLSSASGRLDKTLEDFETVSSDLSTSAKAIAGFTTRLETLADTADVTLGTATETLNEGRAMIARSSTTLDTANETLLAMDNAFTSATSLIDGDLAALITQGTATAQKVEEALNTLEAPAVAALERAETTLSEAEQTFASANQIFGEDIDGMISDIRNAVSTFETALISASENFDAVSQEVLIASQSAANFTGVLESVAVANRMQMSRFLQYGLPEFLNLTEDAGQLVRNLQRFVDRIDRDPARYFLGTQGSEFSR